MKMEIEVEKYRTIRKRAGATDTDVEAEIAEMSAGAPVVELSMSDFSAGEIRIAKDMVGNDPVALKRHLNNLAAYKRERAEAMALRDLGGK